MNRVLRPVVDLVAWLAPTWRIAAVETNKLFPDIQARFVLRCAGLAEARLLGAHTLYRSSAGSLSYH